MSVRGRRGCPGEGDRDWPREPWLEPWREPWREPDRCTELGRVVLSGESRRRDPVGLARDSKSSVAVGRARERERLLVREGAVEGLEKW